MKFGILLLNPQVWGEARKLVQSTHSAELIPTLCLNYTTNYWVYSWWPWQGAKGAKYFFLFNLSGLGEPLKFNLPPIWGAGEGSNQSHYVIANFFPSWRVILESFCKLVTRTRTREEEIAQERKIYGKRGQDWTKEYLRELRGHVMAKASRVLVSIWQGSIG